MSLRDPVSVSELQADLRRQRNTRLWDNAYAEAKAGLVSGDTSLVDVFKADELMDFVSDIENSADPAAYIEGWRRKAAERLADKECEL